MRVSIRVFQSVVQNLEGVSTLNGLFEKLIKKQILGKANVDLHTQKYAFIKESTIFTKSLQNFAKIRYSYLI